MIKNRRLIQRDEVALNKRKALADDSKGFFPFIPLQQACGEEEQNALIESYIKRRRAAYYYRRRSMKAVGSRYLSQGAMIMLAMVSMAGILGRSSCSVKAAEHLPKPDSDLPAAKPGETLAG